ncbi:hypothetical protein GE061_007650 [Apolygus lucorum]|uniref:Uncharacterized protein n=1 Tax=Apolygus lucorum TaxID=248454 RepID=A0A6A4IVH8_APOLU|nr:hypothetical protein GE061_007650 [Apolygus lucorum]
MSQRSLPEFFTPRLDTPKRRRSSPPSEDKKRPKKKILGAMDTEEKVGQLTVSQLMESISNLIDGKGLATKQDLASTNLEIAALKKENSDLRKKIDNLNVRLNVYDRNMRKNNLVFGGFEHKDPDFVAVIEDFLKQVLKIERNIVIGRAFPLGKQGLNRCPILVEFVRGEDVNLIMSRVGCLRGTGFFVHRDYSQEERIVRSKLSNVKNEILKLKKDVSITFKRDTLVVDNIEFKWDLDKGFQSSQGEDGAELLKAKLNLDLKDAVMRLGANPSENASQGRQHTD